MKIEGALIKRDMNNNCLKKERRWSSGLIKVNLITAVLY